MAGLTAGCIVGCCEEEDDSVSRVAVEVFAKLKVLRPEGAPRGGGAGRPGPLAEVGGRHTRHASPWSWLATGGAACEASFSATWVAPSFCSRCPHGPSLVVRADAARRLRLNFCRPEPRVLTGPAKRVQSRAGHRPGPQGTRGVQGRQAGRVRDPSWLVRKPSPRDRVAAVRGPCRPLPAAPLLKTSVSPSLPVRVQRGRT